MLRVDYVSPLPPARTGIADYSADLLPHLGERCDLRLVALPGQAVSPLLAARWPVVTPAGLGNERLPLYQMGNNELHRPVWEAALRVPGVLVLHDLVLHHFLLGRTLGQAPGDFDGYRAQLAADHGWVGELAAAPARWGFVDTVVQFALPARRSLLRAQRGVLVHSAWAVEELHAEDPELRARQVPMAVPLPPPADAAAGAALRARLGIPEGAPVLGSFGFQTPMKRTHVAVRALARPELASAHLLVAGEVSPIVDLVGLARQLGVADRVHVLGYVEFAELEAAIAASDLCLNLRYPTAGETSASLLRILAVGRPTIVNEYAQFRDLPDEAVVKVPLADSSDPDGEAAALAPRLAELLAAPEALQRLGEAARAHVAREHDPARAAAAIVAACSELADAEPPGPAPAREPLPRAPFWEPLAAAMEVEPLDGWSPGERRTIRVRLRNTGEARWLAAHRGLGGTVLRVVLRGEEGGVVEELPWIEMPRDVDPGEEHVFTVPLRRPLGAARLQVAPCLLELGDAWQFGGPRFEGEV
ncbi:MAG TPA: glycosyltransferase family 4 protein [Thermoanaerobaculia bacterium]|jgi:glycosyltransferase involved in cell wall biosynthesis|nr:glycosyltransferase family 4 protein [Thermoanaerobaculia bacterium]